MQARKDKGLDNRCNRHETGTMRKILNLVAVLEAVTGLALLIVPGIVIRLLLGQNSLGQNSLGAELALGRFLGIALLALGLACWPGQQAGSNAPVFRAMLVYNLFVAILLTYLGAVEHFFGLFLWPAVALHFGLAAVLVRARRSSADHA
jgi:hypothetical protein